MKAIIISSEVSVEQFVKFKILVIFTKWVVQRLGNPKPAKDKKESEQKTEIEI